MVACFTKIMSINAPLAYLTLLPAAALSNLPFSNEAALTLNILVPVLAAYILSSKALALRVIPLAPCAAVAFARRPAHHHVFSARL